MPHTVKRNLSKISTESIKDHTNIMKSRTSRIDLNITGDIDGGTKAKTFLKPDNQLALSQGELEQEFVRVLTMENCRFPNSWVQWSWKDMEFIKLPNPPRIVTILKFISTLIYRESQESIHCHQQIAGHDPLIAATKQIVQLSVDDDEEDDENKESMSRDEIDKEEEDDTNDMKQIGDTDIGNGEPLELEVDDEDDMGIKKPKKIPNQFNFCERAALTYNNPVRDTNTQTAPPPTGSFNSNVFQWTIFDEYQEDYARQQREKEKERKIIPSAVASSVPIQSIKKDDIKKNKDQVEVKGALTVNQRMVQSAKILERMVNQNIFDEISQDYRYWNDPSDEFKDGEGSLLPLWKFQYEPTKKHHVTGICFNTRYYDLFAISFGSLSYDSPVSNGAVCLFSLKNPSYPEWSCTTASPVMCLDFNIQHPHLLVIGMMDGTVAVYNVMLSTTIPQYTSNEVVQKHGGIVWEIKWSGIKTGVSLPTDTEGGLTFYSASIDGKINHWVLNQNELSLTTIMTLYLDRSPIPGPDGTLVTLKACGTCIAFHPTDSDIFLVGTEEGTIYKCNTAYSSIYMQIYNEAHNMPVYRIVFNIYNSNIFASCSGDWRIKIWEDNRLEPLFMFDLGVPIGDIQWAPYSSTVIASVSNDGRVTIFDLNVNKYRPICSQLVASKKRSKLTRLAFNNVLPLIIVGDDRGGVNTFKLSPNLRIQVKPTKKQVHLSRAQLESMKLERLLSFVREPPILLSS